MSVCPCCVEKQSARALAGSVAEIPPTAFDCYAWKAMTTFGGVDDFKRVLPRMLELVCFAPGEVEFEIDQVFSKLEYARWQEWPQDEQDAIFLFLRELWMEELRAPGSLFFDQRELFIALFPEIDVNTLLLKLSDNELANVADNDLLQYVVASGRANEWIARWELAFFRAEGNQALQSRFSELIDSIQAFNQSRTPAPSEN